MSNLKIAFLGGGNMGEALIKGLLDAQCAAPEGISVTDISRTRLKYLKKTYKVQIKQSNIIATKEADVVILAVKPNTLPLVLEEIGEQCKNKVVVSIAAGVTSGEIYNTLPPSTQVTRVMPNTPALVGEGISALCFSENTENENRAMLQEIFGSVGKTVIVNEGMMDAVTGLSGSGPAFVFLAIEALSDGGVKMGLPRDIAVRLAAQTVKGAAEMVLTTNKHAGELKDMVTSPGGTTIAGVHALEQNGLRNALISAVEAASKKSEELGQLRTKAEIS